MNNSRSESPEEESSSEATANGRKVNRLKTRDEASHSQEYADFNLTITTVCNLNTPTRCNLTMIAIYNQLDLANYQNLKLLFPIREHRRTLEDP